MIFNSILFCFFVLFGCSKPDVEGPTNPANTNPLTNDIEVWVTSANQASKLKKQSTILAFTQSPNNYPVITVDSSTSYQSIDGFGYTLTGGSAMLLNSMSSSSRENILTDMFGCIGEQACISYLRVSLGASDLDDRVFSYNDLPTGQEDLSLSSFSLSRDTINLIPVIKQILKIQPNIKFMASPWSPPVWMKSNGSSIGGSLLPKYYDVYADYFVKYINAMKTHGITIDAVTVQNEPQHGGNNPSLLMTAAEQAVFIKNHLGPKCRAAGLNTKIVIWDHNCDRPEYPISILNDSEAKSFIDGSAFHLYAGDISALSQVHAAHPDRSLYFTEQWTGSNGSFEGDLQWHVKNVVIGSMRNWSKVALEWNLASDPIYDPHTPGGCTQCKGALTIDGNIVTKNVGYYIITHASRFVPPGSVRIESNTIANISQAVFLTPTGKKVMIALNDTDKSEIFAIQYKGKKALASLDAHSVATFVW